MEHTAWQHGPDHNRRRITRVLKSLVLQDMNNAARNFYHWCVELSVPNTPPDRIQRTLIYWNEAVAHLM